ncbi:MAG TPA: sulfotransferase [Nitrosomonas sp.]|nr:sulfotransferase [Nitrosomonas sp.]
MKKLIIICGMPRSGTTWLGKIFDSHPEILYRHEPDAGGKLNLLPLFTEAWVEEELKFIKQFISELESHTRVNQVSKFPIFKKIRESDIHFQVRKAYLTALKIASRYFGNFSAYEMLPNQSDMTIVWKSIESLGRMPIMAQAVQELGIEAYFIHIIRHPCGQLNSTLRGQAKQVFTGNYNAAEDEPLFKLLASSSQAQLYELTVSQFQQMNAEQRLTWRWALMNDFALRLMENKPNYFKVRYEDICQEPELTTKELFTFCKLGWNEQTAHFLEMSTKQDVSDYYSVIKNPLNSANAWRKKLSEQQINDIFAVSEKTLSGKLYLPRD